MQEPPATSSGDPIVLRRFIDVAHADALVPGLDAVFFQTSATQSFASEADRDAFRERWLGRYLTHDPNYVYVALHATDKATRGGGQVVGYLVGALDDPAQTSRFSDLGYFRVFAPQTARFPAQLHVNLVESVRGQGIGRQLVERFVGDAAEAGAPGVHVVTGKDARNVSFYSQRGFNEVARTDWKGHTLVMLGRKI